MKRFGRICLITLLIAAVLLAYLNRERLRAPFGGEEPGPIDLDEERPVTDGEAEEGPELTAVGLKSLALQITAEASSDYEKLTAIYDWVTANIAYDVEKANNMEDYGSGAEYLLEKRKGVCHDYADLTRALLKAVGIKVTYEKGEVHPAPGRTERHAWNHARIGETWYGLDTTWGAGFVDEEKGVFVQRPSPLYLTTSEELARLHNDPAYKEAREREWQRAEAAAAKPVYLPEHEARLLVLFNEMRAATGLTPFTEEARLLAAARQSAAAAAEQVCSGEEYSLDPLKAELERRAPELRLAKAGMYMFTLWDYPIPTSEELHRLIIAEEDTYLNEAGFQSLIVGVIRRGDLITVTLVYLSYY